MHMWCFILKRDMLKRLSTKRNENELTVEYVMVLSRTVAPPFSLSLYRLNSNFRSDFHRPNFPYCIGSYVQHAHQRPPERQLGKSLTNDWKIARQK